ncbi:MAG: hypothetical protein WD851_13630 [Pirellulales bacterium]
MADPTRRQFLTIGAASFAGGVLVCAGTAHATPQWVDERQAGPFIFHSTFPLGPYEKLFSELPKLQQHLRGALATAPPRDPIYVHLLANRAQHEAYVCERFPSIPYRRALFVKTSNQSNVFAYRHEDLATDLRHECTHALLHSDLSTLPLWLDEGVAEYFETPAEQRVAGSPHLAELDWSLRLGIVVDVPALEKKRELTELTALDYRFAWAWIHFLLHGPPAAHRELSAFLIDLRRGTPAGDFSERLAAATPKPNEQLIRHFRNWRTAI